MAELFPPGRRTDLSPGRHGEPTYTFLNRSGTSFADRQRTLITEWLARMPAEHALDPVRRMQSGKDDQFEAAFWEVYLHEAYTRGGYDVTIHPTTPGVCTHPDFLIEGDGSRFYLEAVRASPPAATVRDTKLVNEVRRILATVTADRFMLQMAKYTTVTKPLNVAKLRQELTRWVGELDYGEAADTLAQTGSFSALPRLLWRGNDGWVLEFIAIPIKPERIGAGQQLVPGYEHSIWSHDASRINVALDSKATKYGDLNAPLVIAVLSNDDSAADVFDFEDALYGAWIGRHASAQLPRSDQVHRSGHWCVQSSTHPTGPARWRRSHTPQVIAGCNLVPWTITRSRPVLWSTLEPGVPAPIQPGWLARATMTDQGPQVKAAQPPAELFGLPDDWPGRAEFSNG